MIMIQKSFVAACKDYFGFLPDQSLLQFRDELQKLTPEDKEYFKREFKTISVEIITAA